MPTDDELYPWRVGPPDLMRSVYQCADKADAERLAADCNRVRGGGLYSVRHIDEIRRLQDEAAAKSAVPA
jgi:hypothetical protein